MRKHCWSRAFRTLRRHLHDAWYWLKCCLWYRYNVVVCRTLPPTWCDRDYLLLHAAFQILEDFIDKEQPWEFTGNVYATYLKTGDEEGACTREVFCGLKEPIDETT